MKEIGKNQQAGIVLIGAAVGTITAVIGIMAYIDSQKHRQMQQDLFSIDKQIKLLQLAQAKDRASSIPPATSTTQMQDS